jgi:hypothetical protein
MTELHLLDVNITWMNEKYLHTHRCAFPCKRSVTLALSKVPLCFAWNYEFDYKTQNLLWAI